MVPVTALQAILRSQIELAINGNYRAQRDILKAVQHLEFLKSIGEYRETYVDDETDIDDEIDVDDEPDVDDETDVGGETDVHDETDEAGESDEEDESRDADETGESDEEDETKPAAPNAGNPSPSSGRVDASAASGRVGMTRHRSPTPPGAYGATLPHSPSKTGVNALMDGEGGECDETGSDGDGAAVTAAPDPAPPPENGAVPPVSSAAPRVPSALRRPASPPSRRRTPAGSRGGRRHAVTTERATGGGPTARKPDRIAREFQIGGNFPKKSLLNSLFSGNRPPATHRRVRANQPVLVNYGRACICAPPARLSRKAKRNAAIRRGSPWTTSLRAKP